MAAIGRFLPFDSLDFRRSEYLLLGKADIKILTLEELLPSDHFFVRDPD